MQGIVIHPFHECGRFVLHRRRHDDLLRAGLQVRPRLLGCPEIPRCLDHDVDAEILPGAPGRFPLLDDGHLRSVDAHVVVVRANGGIEAPVQGIVFQEVRAHVRIR